MEGLYITITSHLRQTYRLVAAAQLKLLESWLLHYPYKSLYVRGGSHCLDSTMSKAFCRSMTGNARHQRNVACSHMVMQLFMSHLRPEPPKPVLTSHHSVSSVCYS